MINCNEITIESERLKSMFEKCYNLKAIDLRDIVGLVESVYACGSGDFELKTINGQSIFGVGDLTVTADVDGTETKIQQGTGIFVSGSGSIANPYIITNELTEIDGSETKINQGSNITIAGTGTINDPYVINAEIPAADAQVNADWSSISGVSMVLNKPEIPAAQVNSDWNAVSGITMILNKPNALNTNLNYIPDEFGGTITSSNGSSATLPLVSDDFPGLVSKEMLTNSSVDLDNIKIEILIDAPEVETKEEFAAIINNITFVEILGNQIPTFKAIKITEDSANVFYVEILGRGKGGYGVNGYQLSSEEIKVTSFTLLGSNIEDEVTTQIIDLGENALDVISVVNNKIPNLVIQDQEDGYVLIKGSFSGIYKEYLWIGVGGIYGGEVGAGQATITDLKELNKESTLKATSTQSGTVKTNLTVSDPIVYLKETSDLLLDQKEEEANKATNFSIKNDIKYPTTKAVSEHVDLSIYNHQLTNNNSSTGLVEGGVITIASATTVNISSGYGIVVNNTTTPQAPSLTRVSWTQSTGILINSVSTQAGTAFFRTAAGDIVQQDISSMSNSIDIRGMIYMGSVGHPNGSAINVFSNPIVVTNTVSNFSDLFNSIGPFSISGNKLKKITGTLNLLKTVGKSYFANANYQNNKTSPNVFTTLLFNGGSLNYVKSTGFLGPLSSSIDSDKWDNLGTLTNLGGNNFAAHRIWHQPSANLLFFQYGQAEYASLSLAKSGFVNEDFIVPSPLEFGAYLIGIVIVKKGEVNLDNPLNSDIIPQSKFSGTGSGGGGIVPTLQLAYEGSIQPQIKTNSGKGGLVIERGSASDSDKVLDIRNGAGTSVSNFKGNGELTALNYNGYIPESNLNKAINFSTVNNTLYPTIQAVKTYTDSLVLGLLNDRGAYNASSNLFPSTGGSGSAGSILKGDIWYIGTAGTLGGNLYSIGSSVRAISNAPGQTSANWAGMSSNLNYVPANANRNIATNSPLQGGANLTSDITLSIQQATSSVNGYISFTDWNTFNNKVSNQTHTGDVSGATVLTLATVNSNVGSFGNAANVSQVTVSAKGLTTSASSIPIQITESQVTGLVSDLAGKEATIGTKLTAFNKNFGTTSGTVTEGNDSRLIDSRTPTAGSGNYIQNQNVSAQSANMWISGAGTFGGAFSVSNASYSALDIKGASSGDVGGGILKFHSQTKQFAELTGETESANNGVMIFRTLKSGVITEALKLASTGAATFSSSVIASNGTLIGGTGTSGFIPKWTGTGTQGNSDATTTTGNLMIPSTINLGSTYNSGADAFDKLKIYLFKGATETYGFGVGGNADVQYWAGGTGTGTHKFFTGLSERMRITSSGNVLIGTTTDDGVNKLQVAGSSRIGDGSATVNLNIRATAGGTAVAIPTNGLVLATGYGVSYIHSYNIANSLSSLNFNASNYEFDTGAVKINNLSGTGTRAVVADASGNLSAPTNLTQAGSITATGFFNSSDRRLKDELKRDGDVAYFTWKDKRDSETHIGYIAQEVAINYPDQVKKGSDGMLSVNYIEVMVAKIQDLEKRIKILEGGKNGI